MSEQDGPARGKEHINGKSGGERNKKAALRRAEAAVHTKGTAAADRPAAGGDYIWRGIWESQYSNN